MFWCYYSPFLVSVVNILHRCFGGPRLEPTTKVMNYQPSSLDQVIGQNIDGHSLTKDRLTLVSHSINLVIISFCIKKIPNKSHQQKSLTILLTILFLWRILLWSFLHRITVMNDMLYIAFDWAFKENSEENFGLN